MVARVVGSASVGVFFVCVFVMLQTESLHANETYCNYYF